MKEGIMKPNPMEIIKELTIDYGACGDGSELAHSEIYEKDLQKFLDALNDAGYNHIGWDEIHGEKVIVTHDEF
ncbi:hypothetical protein [Bacillus mycoides]|uniref:hypothetical protein n=1 Tax=Bacillus mycoides TaxID=1405 RepID=UPI000BF9DB8A|nr:hypothetical protein [Bacillus mycoides]PGA05591.1 hypothetical protein COL71_25610 [Bacillus mycoides]